jgi:hypothetical protein
MDLVCEDNVDTVGKILKNAEIPLTFIENEGEIYPRIVLPSVSYLCIFSGDNYQ